MTIVPNNYSKRTYLDLYNLFVSKVSRDEFYDFCETHNIQDLDYFAYHFEDVDI
jgi:hypothetical protein